MQPRSDPQAHLLEHLDGKQVGQSTKLMKSIPCFGQVLHVGLARAVLIKRPLEKVRDKYLALKIGSNSHLDHFTFSSFHFDSEVLSIFCIFFMRCCLLKLEG